MVFWSSLWLAFKEIIRAPFVDSSIWWVLAPVILFWFVLEIYFTKHKGEELGWNTALGNGISLTWITVTLMKYLFEASFANFKWGAFILVLLIMLYGFFIAYISFKHLFTSKTTFILASPTPIYYLAGIAILWAYGTLVITWYIILDLILIYLVIVGVLELVKKFVPEAEEFKIDSDLGSL